MSAGRISSFGRILFHFAVRHKRWSNCSNTKDACSWTCCVIEDSKPGVAAARAAGMEVIAITNTHPAAELEHAHHVVSSYAEIERLLIGREANARPLDPAE